jgi:hypothetical protein
VAWATLSDKNDVSSKPANEQTFFYTMVKTLIGKKKGVKKKSRGAVELWKNGRIRAFL